MQSRRVEIKRRRDRCLWTALVSFWRRRWKTKTKSELKRNYLFVLTSDSCSWFQFGSTSRVPFRGLLPPYPVLLKRLFGCALGYPFFVTDFWLYQKAIKGYLLGSRSSRSRRSLQVFGKHGELGTERVFWLKAKGKNSEDLWNASHEVVFFLT